GRWCVAHQIATGFSRRHHDDASIFSAAFAYDPALIFETIQNTDHRAGADMDLPADGGCSERPALDDCTQTHQLWGGDVAVGGELTGMKRNGASDTPQRPQDAQVVLGRGIRRNHHVPEGMELQLFL